jgi:UDP-N-acetylglucosamine 1-carboxyvinyltransferase
MDCFLIRGGTALHGTVDISGSKNSSLPILAATLMADGVCTLHGVPRLSDIDSMTRLLESLGCRVTRHEPASLGGTGRLDFKGRPALNGPLEIEVVDDSLVQAHYDIVKTMRASICVLGPMLARRGTAYFSVPGGCAIGDRPVDLHLRGLEKLGATFRNENGYIVGEVPGGRLKGTTMYLGGAQGPTVLGTINVLCAAALAEGTTRIVGAACEPEVSDCANLLKRMGAQISGVGGPEIVVEGVETLQGVEHRVIPDRIEAGTFLIAAAMTGGTLTLRNMDLSHLVAVIDRLEEVGVKIEPQADGDVIVSAQGPLQATEMTTQPYPGFPTDLQAQLMAMLCGAQGISVITERIFPDRFLHIGELNRMGARIRKEGPTAIIHGGRPLHGAPVMCSDLRASAALVLAALVAEGQTRLDRVYHIDRGYEKIEQKLRAVGAQIDRLEQSAAAESAAQVAAA